MSHPASFHDLPPDFFPLIVYAFRRSDGVQVFTETITEPGAFFVPPLSLEHGPVRIRIEFADGSVVDDGVVSEGDGQ